MGIFTPIVFAAGDITDADDINTNFANIKNLLNAGLTTDNVASGGYGAAGHGDLSSTAGTFHKAAGVSLVDSALLYTSSTVEAGMQEIAEFVGKGHSGVLGMFRVGRARDDITVYVNNAANQPAASITVSANTAIAGIRVVLSAYIFHGAAAVGESVEVPLKIGAVNLSTLGSPVPKYTLSFGSDGPASVHCSNEIEYLVADGWNPAISNDIKVGDCYSAAATGNMGAQYFGITVYALR
jgi:hypothetical protein